MFALILLEYCMATLEIVGMATLEIVGMATLQIVGMATIDIGYGCPLKQF